VSWTNNGATVHNVTSNSGAFASGSLNPGATFQYTFTTAGSYPYACTLHAGMNGTVMVTP
jgi:plastocyanin